MNSNKIPKSKSLTNIMEELDPEKYVSKSAKFSFNYVSLKEKQTNRSSSPLSDDQQFIPHQD
jgi:hypothetical protein